MHLAYANGKERTGPKNALVLQIPGLTEEDFAAILGCEGMMSTEGVSTIKKIRRKHKKKTWNLRFGNHQGRVADASTGLHIWARGSFKPVRIRLIARKHNYPWA